MNRTLARITRELLDTTELSPRTKSLYEEILLPFLEIHGRSFPQNIARGELKRYFDGLQHLGFRTQRLHHTVISRLFNFSERMGYSTGNPCRFFTPKKPNAARGEHKSDQEFGYLSKAQLELLFRAANTNPRLLALLTLLYESGMRIAEALTLTMDNLDLAGNKATVIGKGNKKRQCYFADSAQATLRNYMDRHRERPLNYVFTQRMKRSQRVRPLPYRIAYQELRDAIVGIKELEGVSFHDLRHTFATERAQIMPIEILRAIMGHENIATTLLYQKISSNVAQSEAMEALRKLQLNKAV